MQNQGAKKLLEIKSCGKERGGSFGGSCRQLPGAMGGCPRQKPTEVSVKESKSILKKFVPHLGDFVEVSHF